MQPYGYDVSAIPESPVSDACDVLVNNDVSFIVGNYLVLVTKIGVLVAVGFRHCKLVSIEVQNVNVRAIRIRMNESISDIEKYSRYSNAE